MSGLSGRRPPGSQFSRAPPVQEDPCSVPPYAPSRAPIGVLTTTKRTRHALSLGRVVICTPRGSRTEDHAQRRQGSKKTREDQKSLHLRLAHGPKNTTSFMSDVAGVGSSLAAVPASLAAGSIKVAGQTLSFLSDDVLRGGHEITDDELAERLAARMGLVGAWTASRLCEMLGRMDNTPSGHTGPSATSPDGPGPEPSV
jgi:hypothetical protein